MKTTIMAYLKRLEQSDLEGLLSLFAPDAVVHSPLWGDQPVQQFYRDLLGSTSESIITPMHIWSDRQSRTAAVNFLYEWTLDTGQRVQFDCVDIFNFGDDDKIHDLKIIYDSTRTRNAFEAVRARTANNPGE